MPFRVRPASHAGNDRRQPAGPAQCAGGVRSEDLHPGPPDESAGADRAAAGVAAGAPPVQAARGGVRAAERGAAGQQRRRGHAAGQHGAEFR